MHCLAGVWGAPVAARRPERERLRRTVDFLLDHPLASVVPGHFEGDVAVHQVDRGRRERMIRAAAANIRRGQKAGEIPETIDPDLLAAVIIGGLHRAVVLALAALRAPDRAYLTETLWRAVAAMLQLAH